MTGENAGQPDKTRLTALIVESYVAHHSVPAGDLGRLIATVHGALDQLGKVAEEPEPQKSAVSIRRSVQRDVVICLDCGFRAQMLRRHLHMAHGLDPAAYRARWNLSLDHPITAPSYSERRSRVAKETGLGRRTDGTASEPSDAPAERRDNPDRAFAASLSAPKRRGRPRSASSPPSAGSPILESPAGQEAE